MTSSISPSPIFRLARIPRTIRNLGRVREILTVVANNGFEDVVLRLGIEGWVDRARRLFRLRLRPTSEWEQTSVERRIRRTLEQLGPTFIKFGQILATRPDLIPMSLVEELRKLQDDVPAFSAREARRIVERELGKPIDVLFSHFDERPMAAASIGQVHRATLRSGEDVVVKVQRPGLVRMIQSDLDILRTLAALVEQNIPEARQYDPCGLVEEFARSIVKEIDFTREAFHIAKFGRNFAGVEHVHCPEVHDELTTTKVLTMEYVDGIKITDVERLDAAGIDRAVIASHGTRAVLKMIFVDGFFHADPHPGNVLVLPGDVLCFIDYGMMGTVDDERIDDLLVFLVGLLTGDMQQVVELFQRLDLVSEKADLRGLRSEIKSLLDRYGNVPLGRVDIATFISEVFDTIQRHRVAIPSDLLLMGKAIATMEGIAQQIYPAYDPLTEMRSFLGRIYVKRLVDPRYLARGLYRTADAYVYLVRRFPKQAESILSKLGKGELTIRLEDEGLRHETRRRVHATNRVALAIAASVLGLSSTFLLLEPLGPTIAGLHLTTILGTLGGLTSLVLGNVIVLGALRANLE
jgi:ubiquinone biosynthesis protein